MQIIACAALLSSMNLSFFSCDEPSISLLNYDNICGTHKEKTYNNVAMKNCTSIYNITFNEMEHNFTNMQTYFITAHITVQDGKTNASKIVEHKVILWKNRLCFDESSNHTPEAQQTISTGNRTTQNTVGIWLHSILNTTANAVKCSISIQKCETRSNTTGPNNKLTKGIIAFLETLELSTILTFLAGAAFAATVFSLICCCWMCCCRKKNPSLKPDTEFHLETLQSAPDESNEQTPLRDFPDATDPNAVLPDTSDGEDEVMEVREVDYASVDYTALKERPAEEETEPTNTDYAEIKKAREDGECLSEADNQTDWFHNR